MKSPENNPFGTSEGSNGSVETEAPYSSIGDRKQPGLLEYGMLKTHHLTTAVTVGAEC